MNHNDAIDAAKAVLAKCAATDPWFPKPSRAAVQAWAEHFERTNLTLDELLEAVRTFYAQGGDLRPKPGDIITAARVNRQDRFQRQPLAEIEAHWDRLDRRLAALIDDTADRHSVDTALEVKYWRREANPLSVSCPWPGCRAMPGRRCTSGSRAMRVYHPARLEAAAAGSSVAERSGGVEVKRAAIRQRRTLADGRRLVYIVCPACQARHWVPEATVTMICPRRPRAGRFTIAGAR